MTIRAAHGSGLWPARGQAPAWISTGRPTARAATEYLLLSKRTRQVLETEACVARNPSNRPLIGTSLARSGVVRLTSCDRKSPRQDARSHCRHRIPPFARRFG